MPYDVFISHSSIDKPVADAAVAVLERARIRCWVAPRDIMPGSDWGAAIIQGIRGSRLMLVIFSSHSNSSEQVKREVERGVHQGIPIIPLRIENIQPTGSMELFLSTPHWLDAISSPLEAHLEHLARTVQLILHGPDQQPPPPAPGPVWAPAPAPAPDPFPIPQWAPAPAPPQWDPAASQATMPTAFPVSKKPAFPVWLIAVLLGGIIALGGAIYLARNLESFGDFAGMFGMGAPKINSVLFYESGPGLVPLPRRDYAKRFANSGTRYINWDINIQHPQGSQESKLVLQARWTKPDGTIETKQDRIVTLLPDTKNTASTSGWGNKEGNYFHPGIYTVDFYLADKKIGGSQFEVYEGEAPPSNYIQAVNATVEAVNLYESSTGILAKELRRYQKQFPRNSRYINWEIRLAFPAPGAHIPFLIHEVWHRPDGSLEREADFNAFVEPAWTNSIHNSNGWGSAKGGTYQLGTYHVDFYVDKRKVAASSFEIVD